MNIKFIFMSLVVLGLFVNTASFSDLAFADNPDQKAAKEAREDAKKEREEAREDAKKEREDAKKEREDAKKEREDLKEEREDFKEFNDSIVVTSSSSSSTDKVTICHSPPGNPSNAHTITIGSPAARTHLANHSGDSEGSCGEEFKDSEDLKAKKESRLAEKLSEKESNALERAEKLIEKLEQQISNLEERLQSLLEKYESGEYYGNISTADDVTKSYVISFKGTASSIYDELVVTDMSGELFMENQVTTSDASKFKVISGEVIVGTDIYDVVFGKARGSSSGPSGEDNSLVVILQTIDSEENDNTIKIILGFDSPLEGEFGNPDEDFEILDNSKVSGQWILDGDGQLYLE